MKPPPFGYARPETVAEALSILASAGPDAKVLAGGQSLVPLLNMRLAAPSVLVDINRLGGELGYIRTDGAAVTVGALARHADVLRDPVAGAAQTALPQALRLVAHPAIRNRGTAVGSLVHADPAAELPAVLALTGGTIRLASAAGQRVVSAADFFLGSLESDIRPDELAIEARFPALPAGSGAGFAEVSRRRGDYAVCGVAALVRLGADGLVAAARAAYLAVAPRPIVLDLTEACDGTGRSASPDFADAARLAMARIEPGSDLHATAGYRRHLVGVLTQRALLGALANAKERAYA